ncbi:MAG: 4-hydroxy-tetrahydrodipicolinate reductase [Bacteroidetes bacterium 43-16]|nr:MAG: 4-hydroxy-tetrahydrodipicolinate reductase [Bacteroidetes bacterium 43-16]
MKIALLGYGKMGQAIEKIALERGHEIVLKIGSKNKAEANSDNLKLADVIIEFTNPESAFENVSSGLKAGVPVVCGSTGWNKQVAAAQDICRENNTAFLQASNFSIGVNLFFELNKMAAKLMKPHADYRVSVSETHHTQKLDAPSGTAITIAEQILETYDQLNSWSLEPNDQQLNISAFRVDEVPGTHVVKYASEIDDIELTHTAHSRAGFAMGAVVAAEYIQNKKGIFSMHDVLFSNH